MLQTITGQCTAPPALYAQSFTARPYDRVLMSVDPLWKDMRKGCRLRDSLVGTFGSNLLGRFRYLHRFRTQMSKSSLKPTVPIHFYSQPPPKYILCCLSIVQVSEAMTKQTTISYICDNFLRECDVSSYKQNFSTTQYFENAITVLNVDRLKKG